MMMEPFVRRFIRASLIWLGVGVLLGVSMAFWPGQAMAWRPAHVHANLLGFVSMMIFGVAYHVIPRFTGNALHSRRLASLHLGVANAGLALLVGGWITRVWLPPVGAGLVQAGAAVSAAGAFLYIYNLWRTLTPAPRPAAARAPARPASCADAPAITLAAASRPAGAASEWLRRRCMACPSGRPPRVGGCGSVSTLPVEGRAEATGAGARG